MPPRYKVPKTTTLRLVPGTPSSDVGNPQEGDIAFHSTNGIQHYLSGSWQTVSAAASGNNTLDQAYDQGGAGAGAAITVDGAAVQLTGSHATNNTFEIDKSAGSGHLVELDASGTHTGDYLRITADTGDGISLNIDKSAGSGAAVDVDVTGGTGIAADFASDQNIDIVHLTHSGAGAGAVLTFSNAGTGNDVTADNWSVTRLGDAIFNDLTLNGSWLNPSFSGDETHTCSATTGVGFLFEADTITSGTGMRVKYDASTMSGGLAFEVYEADGANTDFSIGEDGATIITGLAAGTDAFTITTGDILLNDGRILAEDESGTVTSFTFDHKGGNLASDTTVVLIDDGGNPDSGANMLRLAPTGTPSAGSIGIEFVGAAKVMQAMSLDSDCTADSVALINGGGVLTSDNAVLKLTADGARGTGSAVLQVLPTGTPAAAASYAVDIDCTGQTHTNNPVQVRIAGGDTTAASLQVVGTGAIAASAGMAHFTHGTGAIAAAGAIVRIDGNAAAAGATAYGLEIDCNAANLEGIHVDAGTCLFDEEITCDGGIQLNDGDAITLGTDNDFTIAFTDADTNVDITVAAGGNVTVGDGGTSNYANIDENGALTLLGTARRTKSLWLDAHQFSAQAGTPALATVGNGRAFSFDADADEAIATTFRVPDNWVSGTDATVYIHSSTADTNTNDVIWDVITTPLAENEDTTSAGNTDSTTDTAVSATANDLNTTAGITVTASTEWASGDMVILKINRDADNVADTIAADCVLWGVQIDYTADRI